MLFGRQLIQPEHAPESDSQQEHAMKSKNGGLGMTDEQVENFVARYMPGYECFGAGIETRWKGALLRIVIDLQRQVADVQHL